MQLNTKAAAEAIQRLAQLPPIASAEEATRLLDEANEGPEESHIEADEILIRYLKGKGQAGNDVALAWLYCRARNGFWYA